MQQEQVGIYNQGACLGLFREMLDWNGKLLVGDIKGRRILGEGRTRTRVGDEDFWSHIPKWRILSKMTWGKKMTWQESCKN